MSVMTREQNTYDYKSWPVYLLVYFYGAHGLGTLNLSPFSLIGKALLQMNVRCLASGAAVVAKNSIATFNAKAPMHKAETLVRRVQSRK